MNEERKSLQEKIALKLFDIDLVSCTGNEKTLNWYKCRRSIFEFISTSTIFMLTILAILMRGHISNDNPALFISYGDYYLVYWFPLFVYISFAIVAIYFLVKAWLFKSCIYTKIISTSYFLGKTITLIQMFLVANWEDYIIFWDFVMYVGVILTGSAWIVVLIIKGITNKLNNKRNEPIR